jgi:hypothetical protein
VKNRKIIITIAVLLIPFIFGIVAYANSDINTDKKVNEVIAVSKEETREHVFKRLGEYYDNIDDLIDKDNIKLMDKKIKISDNIYLLIDAVFMDKNSTLIFYTIEDSIGESGAWTYSGIISNIKINNINYINNKWTVPGDENQYEILYYGVPSKKEKEINIFIETQEDGTKKLNLPIEKVNFVNEEYKSKKVKKLDEETQISNNIFKDEEDPNKKFFSENDGNMTFEHFDGKEIVNEITMHKTNKLTIQYDSEIKEGYFFIWITNPKDQIIDGFIKRNEKGIREVIAKESGTYKVGVLGVNTSGKARVFVKGLEGMDKTYKKSNKDEKKERYFEEIKKFDYAGIKDINIDADVVNVELITEKTGSIRVEFDGELVEESDKNIIKEFQKPKLVCTKSKEILEIGVDHPKIFSSNDCFYYFKTNLKIYIPEEYNSNISFNCDAANMIMDKFKLDKLNIEGDASNLNISRLECKDIDIESDASCVKIESVKSKNIVIDSSCSSINMNNVEGIIKCDNDGGAIEINCKQLSNPMQIDADAGSVKISCTELNNNLNIDCNTGNIQLRLPKDSQFEIDAYVECGTVNNEFTLVEFDEKTETKIKGVVGSNDTDKYINLKAECGSISIMKQ